MAMTTPEAALFAARMADEDGSNASVPDGGQMDQGTSFHVQNLPFSKLFRREIAAFVSKVVQSRRRKQSIVRNGSSSNSPAPNSPPATLPSFPGSRPSAVFICFHHIKSFSA